MSNSSPGVRVRLNQIIYDVGQVINRWHLNNVFLNLLTFILGHVLVGLFVNTGAHLDALQKTDGEPCVLSPPVVLKRQSIVVFILVLPRNYSVTLSLEVIV